MIVQDKTKQPFLDDVMASLSSEPLPIGSVAQAVMRLTTDPRVSANRLARAIEADAGLACAIIRKANSSYYGGTRKVQSLPLAISRLGSLTTRSVAVASAIRAIYRFTGDTRIERYLWRHSVATGLASRITTRQAKIPFTEEAYLCGLLHDVAKLILVQRFYPRYEPVIRDIGLMIGGNLHVELAHLGFTHADLGALILERWEFAPMEIDAVRFHHAPAKSRDCGVEGVQLAYVICFANELAKAVENNGDSDLSGILSGLASASGFDFTEDDIHHMSEELRTSLGDELQVFSG